MFDLIQELGMKQIEILEVPIIGMDCTECTMHVKKAIAALPGVKSSQGTSPDGHELDHRFATLGP